MYERFTDRARKAMAYANHEAHRLKHDYIGPEHIALGLVKEGTGVGAMIMVSLGLELSHVSMEVNKALTPGSETVAMGKLPQTPLGKRAVEYAIDEARQMHHNYVGTEHLLLGVIGETGGIGGNVLRGLGLTLEIARAQLLLLWEEFAEGDQREEELLTPAAMQRFKKHRLSMMGRCGEAAQLIAQAGTAPASDYLGGQVEERVEQFLVGLPKERLDALMERVRRARWDVPGNHVFSFVLTQAS